MTTPPRLSTPNIREKFASFRRGLLELAVLSAISGNILYGDEILEKLSLTEFFTSEGTLYPLLSKLRKKKYVLFNWEETDSGPPRKYYYLTPKGKKHLEEAHEYWNFLSETISSLQDPDKPN